jgi:AraC-like DNA-binding protein
MADPDDAFAHIVEQALRRQLSPRHELRTVRQGFAAIAFHRAAVGGWRLRAGDCEFQVDDLSVGAIAARHLVAVGAKALRFAGSGNGLRWRGFSIAAGALGCDHGLLDKPAARGDLVGIFADGETAERSAQAFLRMTGLSWPDSALLVGVDEGPALGSALPGWSRIRLDPNAIAAAVLAAMNAPGDSMLKRVLIQPAGVVTRASSDAYQQAPQIAAALDFLREHLQRPIGVEHLAKAAKLSRRSLERLFRASLGRSPLEEIRRQRILRAQEYLTTSDLGLAAIADRCGFGGADRFGCVFRQVMRMTPGAWRSRQHNRLG